MSWIMKRKNLNKNTNKASNESNNNIVINNNTEAMINLASAMGGIKTTLKQHNKRITVLEKR